MCHLRGHWSAVGLKPLYSDPSWRTGDFLAGWALGPGDRHRTLPNLTRASRMVVALTVGAHVLNSGSTRTSEDSDQATGCPIDDRWHGRVCRIDLHFGSP